MKTIGILGGMGPEATLSLYGKIVNLTPAKKDQEHIPTVIYSNTRIPDRTESILNGEDDFVINELQRSAKVLENAGADFIIIPCNTAHHYIEHIRRSVGIPVLDMIDETARCLRGEGVKKTALLATDGTVKTGIYQQRFSAHGIKVLLPGKTEQKAVMNVIYSHVKAGNFGESERKKITQIADKFRTRGVSSILGCTELSVLFDNDRKDGMTDPLDVLARAAVKQALE